MKTELKPWRIYYGMRTVFLAASLLFTVAWIYAGYDSTFEQIFDPDPTHDGIGIHNSTLQSMTMLTYLIMVNMQVGGITSFKQLWGEFKLDLKGIFSRGLDVYEDKGFAVHPFRAFFPALFVSVAALFVFEIPYVFMLNWFHYADLMWPTYVSIFYPSGVFYRNLLIPVACIVCSLWFLRIKGNNLLGSRPRISFRVDDKLAMITVLLLACWVLWIQYPSSSEVKTPDMLVSNLTKPWIMPAQKLFPQNTYVFFNASLGEDYQRNDLDGFHVVEDGVHTINIVTKYMTFLMVGYIFMVRVKKT